MGRSGDSLGARSRAHLDAIGEDYAEHRRFAVGFGLAMVKGGLACMVHGLVPALFTDTGSRTVRALNAVIEHRERLAPAAPRREGLPVLLFLALVNAAVPWLAGAPIWAALPLTLLSLAFIPAYWWSEARGAAEKDVEEAWA
ncbi:MAG TPA: DUF6356 family protein [Allosphingosinicella sp.]|jgi:hypothetical protein|nr:DUF6356 family protein [Allosphingosinicella sp.]